MEDDESDAEVDPRNKLNELTGKEWIHFTRSTRTTTYDSVLGHDIRKEHSANKPPQICKEFIEFFTKSENTVLDPFAGVGGTLLGASLANRNGIGIEISEKWIDLYHEVCESEEIDTQKMIQGDSRQSLKELKEDMGEESVDFILTDPPYYQTDTEGTSSDDNDVIDGFSNSELDVGQLTDKNEFYEAIAEIMDDASQLLKEDKYAVVFMKNRYIDGEYHPLSYELAEKIQEETNLNLRGEHVWLQQGTTLYPFGYPYAYVPNTVHQNILVFRKESE